MYCFSYVFFHPQAFFCLHALFTRSHCEVAFASTWSSTSFPFLLKKIASAFFFSLLLLLLFLYFFCFASVVPVLLSILLSVITPSFSSPWHCLLLFLVYCYYYWCWGCVFDTSWCQINLFLLLPVLRLFLWKLNFEFFFYGFPFYWFYYWFSSYYYALSIAKSIGHCYVFPHTPIATTINFNGDNYLLWSQSFCIFVGAQKQTKTPWWTAR